MAAIRVPPPSIELRILLLFCPTIKVTSAFLSLPPSLSFADLYERQNVGNYSAGFLSSSLLLCVSRRERTTELDWMEEQVQIDMTEIRGTNSTRN